MGDRLAPHSADAPAALLLAQEETGQVQVTNIGWFVAPRRHPTGRVMVGRMVGGSRRTSFEKIQSLRGFLRINGGEEGTCRRASSWPLPWGGLARWSTEAIIRASAPRDEDRLLHAYVIGKTAPGISTLLGNMAIQDLTAGTGFALIRSVSIGRGDRARKIFRIPSNFTCLYGGKSHRNFNHGRLRCRCRLSQDRSNSN